MGGVPIDDRHASPLERFTRVAYCTSTHWRVQKCPWQIVRSS